MRNLKKVLSLALALVMLLGMMVVGASAADFKDASSIKNEEAVDVVSGIEVLKGDEKGNFNPEGTLTRAEAAVVIAKLDLGEAFGNLATTNASTFTDVGANHWAKAYIDYCAARGLIAGNGAGKFMPNDKVSGVQFALMVARVLGYEDKAESVGGAEWEVKAAALARKAGLTKDVVLSSNPMTRDEMAQVAFNALKADMVYYDQPGTEINTGNGSIIIGGTPAEPKSNRGTDYAGNDEDLKLQLCEEKFPKLELKSDGTDDFGRPASLWTYKGDEIKTVDSDPVVTFNSSMKEKDIFTKVGASGINGSTARYIVMDKIYENGVQVAASKQIGTTVQYEADSSYGSNGYDGTVVIANGDSSNAAGFGNGTAVEIYATEKANHYIMVITKTTMAKVTNIVTTKDKTTYTIGGVSYADFVDEKDEDKIVLNGDVAKGDYVTFAVVKGKAHVWPTTKVTGIQTAKTNNNVITVEGEKYTIGTNVVNVNPDKFANSTKEANYYIDNLGYAVETDSTASTDYAYIANVSPTKSTSVDGDALKVQVRAVLADGTVGVYDVSVGTKGDNWVLKGTSTILVSKSNVTSNSLGSVSTALNNKTFGYTLSDDTISLEPLTALPSNSSATADDTVYDISLGNVVKKNKTSYTAHTDKTVLADKNTVFVIYNATSKKASVCTGASSLPTDMDKQNSNAGGTGYAVLKTGKTTNVGTASVIFVNTASGVTVDSTDEYVYVDAGSYIRHKTGSDLKWSYKYTKQDGTVVEKEDCVPGGQITTSGVYVLKDDGSISNSKPTRAQYVAGNEKVALKATDTQIGAIGSWYDLADDTNVVYIDDVGKIDGNTGWVILKVKNGSVTAEVETVFVTKPDGNAIEAVNDATPPAGSNTAATLQKINGLAAENTLVKITGDVKKGIPSTASSVFPLGKSTVTDAKGKLMVLELNLPGTDNSRPFAYRITSAANNPANWGAGKYPWPDDQKIEQTTGIKRSVLTKDYTSENTLGVLAFAGSTVTVEIDLDTKLTYTDRTSITAFEAGFVADYTFTFDLSGVNGID